MARKKKPFVYPIVESIYEERDSQPTRWLPSNTKFNVSQIKMALHDMKSFFEEIGRPMQLFGIINYQCGCEDVYFKNPYETICVRACRTHSPISRELAEEMIEWQRKHAEENGHMKEFEEYLQRRTEKKRKDEEFIRENKLRFTLNYTDNGLQYSVVEYPDKAGDEVSNHEL